MKWLLVITLFGGLYSTDEIYEDPIMIKVPVSSEKMCILYGNRYLLELKTNRVDNKAFFVCMRGEQ